MNIIEIISRIPIPVFLKVQIYKIYLRKWVFSLVFFVTVIPFTIYFYSIPEEYSNKSSVRIITNPYISAIPELFESVNLNLGQGKFWEWLPQLRSEFLNQDFVERLIKKTNYLELTNSDDLEGAVNKISQSFDVWIATASSIQITFRSHDPALAQLLAYYAGEAYAEKQNDNIYFKLDNIIELIDEQINKIINERNQIKLSLDKLLFQYRDYLEFEKELDEYKKVLEYDINVSYDEYLYLKIKAKIVELKKIDKQIEILRIQQNISLANLDSQVYENNDDWYNDYQYTTDLDSNTNTTYEEKIIFLESQKNSFEIELEEMLQNFTEIHPRVINLKQQIDKITQEINSLSKINDNIIASKLNNKVKPKSTIVKKPKKINLNVNNKTKLSELQYNINLSEVELERNLLIEEINSLKNDVKRVIRLKNNLKNNEEKFLEVKNLIKQYDEQINTLDNKIDSLISRKGNLKNTTEIIDGSVDPKDFMLDVPTYNNSPINPNRGVHEAIIVISSIVAGIVVVVIVSFFGSGFYMQEEVEKKYNIEVIGVISNNELIDAKKIDYLTTIIFVAFIFLAMMFKTIYAKSAIEMRQSQLLEKPQLNEDILD